MANPILDRSLAISQYGMPQIIAWRLRDLLEYSDNYAPQATSESVPPTSSREYQSEQPHEYVYEGSKSHLLVPIDQHDSTIQVDLNSTTAPCQSGGNNTSLQFWLSALTSYDFLKGPRATNRCPGLILDQGRRRPFQLQKRT